MQPNTNQLSRSLLQRYKFEDVIDFDTTGTKGSFLTQSDTFQMQLRYNGITFYEDNINGFRFSGDANEHISSEQALFELNRDRVMPLYLLHPKAIIPGTIFKPNGDAVKKTHLDQKTLLAVAENGMVYSARCNPIMLTDYTRGAEFERELMNPSLELRHYSVIYDHNTEMLLYDPHPIVINESVDELKQKRYEFISELLPIAQMWVSLHPDRFNDYNSRTDYHTFATLKALMTVGDTLTIDDIPNIPTELANPTSEYPVTSIVLAKALYGAAKNIEMGNKAFNNWINGITEQQYNFLIYKPLPEE